ncbi:MAG: hypothetical protein HYZ34_11105 [Ignavibacteriae bacterium]|nr:hypothetical protein [Ignavibacteriota bacterium]
MLSFFTQSIYTKLLIVFLCCLMIATPVSRVFAQEMMQQDPSAEIIMAQAEADAQEDVSGAVYGIGGFLCGIFGWLAATLSSPEVPAVRLIGKSSNYVSIYSEAYKSKAKSIRTTAACTGWAIGAAVSLIIFAAGGGATSK